MLQVIIAVVFALLVVRYWSDLTGYLDGMVKGDNEAAQVSAQPTDHTRADPGSTVPDAPKPKPEAEPAAAQKQETILDRLNKVE